MVNVNSEKSAGLNTHSSVKNTVNSAPKNAMKKGAQINVTTSTQMAVVTHSRWENA